MCTRPVGWVVLFLAIVQNVACAQRTLPIGVLYSGSGIFASFGLTVRPIVDGWVKSTGFIGPSSDILPTPIYCNVRSNATLASICAHQVINAGCEIILAPETSMAAIVSAIASPLGIPVLVTMAASSDVFFRGGTGPFSPGVSRLWSNQFGLMTPAYAYFNSIIPLLVTKGQSTVTIITTTSIPDIDVCQGAALVVKDWQMQLLDTFTLPPDGSGLADAVAAVNDKKPDVLIVCYRVGCATTLSALSADVHSHTPHALVMFECGNSGALLSQQVGTPAQFIITPLQWDARLRGSDWSDSTYSVASLFPPTSTATSAALFLSGLAGWLQNTTYVPSSLVSVQAAAMYVVAAATKRCNCTDRQGLLNAIPLVSLRSYYGVVRFDDYGQNSAHEMAVTQLDKDYVQQVISPGTSLTMELQVPMPTWLEREYAPLFAHSTSLDITIQCTGSIIAGIYVILIALVYRRRETTVIKGSSFGFLIVSLCGCIILTLATLTWHVDNRAIDCQLRVGLHALGVLIWLCPSIARTVRIDRIYNSQQMKDSRLRVSDRDVLVTACVLAIVPVITVIIYYAGFQLAPILVTIDSNRPGLNRYKCGSTGAGGGGAGTSGLIWALLVEMLGLLIAEVVVAYRIRKVDKRFNDAQATAWAVYNVCFCMLLLVTVHQVLQGEGGSDPTAVIGLMALGIQFTCLLSVSIFIERVYSFVDYSTVMQTKASDQELSPAGGGVGAGDAGSHQKVSSAGDPTRVHSNGVTNSHHHVQQKMNTFVNGDNSVFHIIEPVKSKP